jgi:hypothetical protein
MKLDAEDRKHIMESLTRVGSTKAIGYLPLNTVIDLLEISLNTLEDDARSRGLAAITFEQDRCCIHSGAIYIYDRDTLARLLLASAETLTACRLAVNPDEFVLQIAATWFDRSHPAFSVIAAAFDDSE